MSVGVCGNADDQRDRAEEKRAEARAALLQAIEDDPACAARGGGAVWTAIEPDERRLISRSAASAARYAADLLERIGADGLALAPPEVQEKMLRRIVRSRKAATTFCGAAVWASLDLDERARIARSAAHDAMGAADLLNRIGSAGWRLAPPEARTTLLQALDADLWGTARGGAAVWAAHDLDERARIARSAAHDAMGAADLLNRIGSAGWRLAPPETRTPLLQAICASAEAAARGGGAVWAAHDLDERARIARSAAHDAMGSADLLGASAPRGGD